MGGKGKKRREKNYKEAHGVGKNRLPPPPVRSSLDVIPSKLRKLMSYTSGSGKLSVDDAQENKGPAASDVAKLLLDSNNKLSTKKKPDSVSSESKIEDTYEIDNFSTEKKKKKRKRKQVDDLRFVAELGAVGSKRKERKKKLLEERKKKHKKAKQEDDLNFPGREEIKFGEVVQAPPKLVNVPKRFGSSVNASQERIRLRTIEAYRDQKKWASRPGLHLPTTDLTHHNNVVLPVEK
ncbi:hypothetical protein HanRHA438_Chr03g0149631 [Helianthus annuus]|uniref:Uncharacterized protein n=1 Tax=Helianthus annuus TaxID=4232 RepID=A0A251VBU6_HELAN|nr:uncharacterized protein LOC110931078 [Helianthus annuus]KAF5816791.1 hypothetical protein HanXRQr2_Chr03g0138181 [Helianthus annuus]KAJ0603364.1 hypothetical protein HanIR_Chr03g0149691 [Helianthus annuus]KAJ0610054.1 hypothetical protein HanHA89_Chr03g0126591 [Helianthus annuus]KAJ0775835.1 hypothetical protein HanOQP8_Chr03g0127121 [Helianthus annuus]KAJ0938137.1 hypothetical protein HanRHA438_Chr03g0149631 [Helianthus annuus]